MNHNRTAAPTLTTPYVADPRLMAAITGRPVSEIRYQPSVLAKLQPCDTCRNGCDCDGSKGETSCGHYACWGRAAQDAPRCPGVDYEKARHHVLDAPLAQEQIRAARRRGSDVLARVTAQVLTAAGLVVAIPEQAA